MRDFIDKHRAPLAAALEIFEAPGKDRSRAPRPPLSVGSHGRRRVSRKQFGMLLLQALICTRAAGADTLPGSATTPAPESRTVVFRLAENALLSSSFEVANGTVVRREDWPTLVLAEIGGKPRPETCTGTLVGPRAILTAAHCVDDGAAQALPARLLVGASLVTLRCDIHPDYMKDAYAAPEPRNSHDYALCFVATEKKYAALNALRFEVVETQHALDEGERVMFTGYGCDRLSISSQGAMTWSQAKGKLSIGNALVEAASGTWPQKAEYLTVRSDPTKDPSVCPGDSGAPLFTGVSALKPREGKSRRVRGVNSRVCGQLRGVSYSACAPYQIAGKWDAISSIATTAAPSFRSWAQQWLKEDRNAGAIICGLNRQAGEVPCRD